ncbi:cystathionine beta-lyase [Kockovaella imperatae]|uniref:Cystathionine beta-lyase n=1 Tax=Kockovaella imperatae TaxID=4999 RepID=A0A1Y1UC44_9TREE|nr:cystathionine beta-lyase [Kockovaella imperatae]ORX34655.1 cystathionine beta-lyase [Kockovaella imperatae]
MTTPPTPSDSASLATSIFSLPQKGRTEAEQRLARSANWRFSTLCAAVDTKDQYGASSTPIYQTATFKGMDGQYDYTRSGNPTRGGLESHLARLYGATQTFALSTGMTCLDMILRLVKPGETILAGDDLYGGTNRLLTYLGTHGGIDVRHVDTTRVEELLPHLGPGNKVKAVLLESPTNPLLKIADIRNISKAVKAGSPAALVIVDNTMMSPYLQRPLELGADIVYDSATKYLSGHHDLMAGIIAVADPDIAKSIAYLINSVGSGLAPFDSFLLLRGIKTMSIRMDRQLLTAQLVATYLDELGFLTHYPGLKRHPKYDIHWSQASGAGAVLSFVTGDKAMSERIVGGTRLWGISVSFGAVNSLISMPCLMSHASISAAVRAERGLPENLIRLCCGIEDPRDLIDDLEHALLAAGAIVPDHSYEAVSRHASEEIYNHDPDAWILERARAYTRPKGTDMEKLVKGVQAGLGLGDVERKTIKSDIVVSAPGKVILFGEHAVVHGVSAVATSVDLRCFGVLSPRSDSKVALEVPDLNVEAEWDISALPWNLLPVHIDGSRRVADKELDPPLLAAIESLITSNDVANPAIGSQLAFLYLYMVISAKESNAPSGTFTASSNLPIGAGLGSSAAYSTCIASALLLAHNHIDNPALGESFSSSGPGISPGDTDLIDGWAFLSEKVLHGNPSGIDNAVSVRGGAVSFTRSVGGRKGGLETLNGFSSVRLLLTDTHVPRDTKSLVAGVAAKRLAEPALVDSTFDSIQSISDEARGLLGGQSHVGRDRLVHRLSAMITENHQHLVTLGVSHPSLEMIVSATSAEPFNLSTKLTGAGGGGCAVTLIPDDFPDTELDSLLSTLRNMGFTPHLTSLGVPGLGILSSSGSSASPSQSTDVLPTDEGNNDGMVVPKRAALREAGRDGLASWARGLGPWSYT